MSRDPKEVANHPILVYADLDLKKDLLAFRDELSRVSGIKWSMSNIVLNLVRHGLPAHTKAVLMKEPRFWEKWVFSKGVARHGANAQMQKGNPNRVKYLRRRLAGRGKRADYWRSRVL